MSAPFNPSSNSYQEDIEQMKKCIVYLNTSLYDINKNVSSMSPYIPMLPTQKNSNALRDDIERMHPTVTRLLSDISKLTSEYRAILENEQMNPALEDEMITLNNRLMDIHGRKKALFDNIIKTLAKYHIKSVYAPPNQSKKLNQSRKPNTSLASIKEENNSESSGGRRRKRTLRKKHTKRNRA